jgi:energy-coupling factor transport system permease protein
MTLALTVDHPAFLGGLLVIVLTVGSLCGCKPQMVRSAKLAIPLAVAVALLNGIISREGLTVVARLGVVPVAGRVDVTLEAVVWGLVLGLRVIVVMAVAVLFGAVVDQDSLMSIVRRRAGRFGLTTVVAARLMPLLAADGKRMAEANRTLANGEAASRMQLVTAIATGALDRAADAAAALELRGLGDSPCLAVPIKRPWSGHDRAVLASALIASGLISGALLMGWLDFSSRTQLHGQWGVPLLVALVATGGALLLPFAGAKGLAAK